MEVAEEDTHARDVPDNRCWIELSIAREKAHVFNEMRGCDLTNCLNTARKEITDEVVDVACVCLKRRGGETAFDA